MDWFHTKLQDIIKEKDISINWLSKESGIPYAHLYRVISGTKKLSMDNYKKLIKGVNLNDCETRELNDYFENFQISKLELESIDVFCEILSNLDEADREELVESKKEDSENNVGKVVDQVFSELMNKPDEEHIIHGFIPTESNLWNHILEYLRQISQSEELYDTVDTTLFVSYDNFIREESIGSNLNKLKNIAKLARVKHGVEVKVLKLQNASGMHSFMPYPYYIHIDDCVLMISNELDDCILLTGDEALRFCKRIETYEVTLNIKSSYSALEINNFVLGLQSDASYLDTNKYILRKCPSSTSVPAKMFGNRIRHMLVSNSKLLFRFLDVKINRQFSKRIKSERIKMMSNKGKLNHFLLEDGIKGFMSTGVMDDYIEIMGPFDESERELTINKLLDNTKKGLKLRLIPSDMVEKYPFLAVINQYELYMDVNQVMIAKYIDIKTSKKIDPHTVNPLGKSIDYALVFEFKELYDAGSIFFDRFLDRIAMTEAESIDFIKKLVKVD